MDTDPKTGDAPRTLRIQGELSIFRATELKQALLAEPAATEIDLSGVTDIDTAGLQLLMLAKKHARRSGREVRLVGHSPAVIELFELLHIAGHFGDPMVIDAPARDAPHRN
ncbi:anti-sigma-factor antagonist [Leptothrix cholodnii SP-6]|uniref:Anti-sigma-factor antagonist n=1 Tax=Leptothrix cholodnii (strain ATCC 51168 / LMG 8142 / SP-6) TaxID=395495 RepID=B1Y6M3_LEPCP|nr:STAS domain-containing protein [Leptothrix cholodnii]ACB36051.1 anti-sigma-factor antagonist [Leptothrix cholodnii SP-6]